MIADDSDRFDRGDILANKVRAEIIVRHALLDEVLRNFLTRAFKRENADTEIRELFDESRGCLSSFPAKARMAYALGLIEKATLNDLKELATVRNRFAHLASPDLADKKLKKACEKLAKAEKVTPDNYLSIYREGALRCMDDLREKLEGERQQLEQMQTA